jgi:plasmid stabilization system protein ParE
MKYRVLPRAQQDIRDIDDWVLENFGPGYADKTAADLYDTFDLLADYPQMGIARPDLDKRPVRFFLFKPYWIVYKPGTPLEIHRVYHSARDLSRLNQR